MIKINNVFQSVVCSLEQADVEGNAELEREYEFYGQFSLEDLQNTATLQETQTQVQQSNRRGSIRMRKTEFPDEQDTDYEFTTKVRLDALSVSESTLKVTEDLFESFKQIVGHYVKKQRWVKEETIEGETLKWEIDVFFNKDDQLGSWCKIDLEVKKPLSADLKLPIKLLNSITAQRGNRSEEEIRQIDKLFNETYKITVDETA